MPIGSQWLASAGPAEFDPETIGNSVWFDGPNNPGDYMQRQNGSPFADGKKAIFSFWFQRCHLNAGQVLFGSHTTGGGSFWIGMAGADFWIYFNNGSEYVSNPHYQDSGWYHSLVSFDSTESADADRIKVWINGVEITSVQSYTALPLNDDDFGFSSAQTGSSVMRLGVHNNTSADSKWFDGYMSQACMLESKSIQNGDFAVSDFLDTFAMGTNGSQFIPKADSAIAALASSAGGNSFCLDFSASGDLGNDISSNNQDWTLASMDANNQSVNTPSLTYPFFDYSTSGGPSSGELALLDGNTRVDELTSSTAMGTLAIPDGSWYWEVKYVGGSGAGSAHGICTFDFNTAAELGYNSPSSPASADTRGIYLSNGKKGYGVSSSFNLTSYGSGQGTDTYSGVAVTKSGTSWKIWFSESGTWPISGNPATGANPAYDWTSDYDYTFAIGNWSTADKQVNMVMVAADWQATVPSGFLSLASNNLPTTEYQGIDYFKPLLYAGNGTAIGSGGKAVTGVGFQPDFEWIKNRDQNDDHSLYDSVRGVTKQIETNNQDDETTEAESLTTFGTDGFTVGSLAQVNTNTENYVSYSWAAGGSASANDSGSLDSTVTAADAGHFSIVNWTGNTTLGATVGHGLGGTPEFIMAFNRSTDNENRPVYHKFMTSDHDHLKINEANATSAAGSSIWDISAMSSTLIGLGNAIQSNGSTATNCMIAYAFRTIPGVCKVGQYYGNNTTDGPFIWTGFKVVYVFMKNIGTTNPWIMYDSARDPYNATVRYLHPNSNAAGASGAGTRDIDFLSNGFKLRENDSDINSTNTNRYVYVAMGSLGGNGTLPPIYGQ